MVIRRPVPARPREINYSFCDRFTLVHFSIGAIYSFLDFSFVLALMLALLWEILENPLKAYLPWMFPHATADTFQNSLGDTLAVCIGWGLVEWIR